jgi:hypothetical protein
VETKGYSPLAASEKGAFPNASSRPPARRLSAGGGFESGAFHVLCGVGRTRFGFKTTN